MVDDFLKAWLVDGDMLAAMSYVSDHAYACLAEEGDDPFSFDRGTAPFVLMNNLKAAHEALGPRTSLEGLTVGVRLPIQGFELSTSPITRSSSFIPFPTTWQRSSTARAA